MQFGFLLLILGIILTILGIYGVFIFDENADPPPPSSMVNLMDSIGNWIFWCVLVGPVVLIAGGWYFFDNRQKRKEFRELMETTSKAKFIRNLDRAEFLAWKLTLEHQKQLIEKKKELHIKK
jgi:hypothetical protein